MCHGPNSDSLSALISLSSDDDDVLLLLSLRILFNGVSLGFSKKRPVFLAGSDSCPGSCSFIGDDRVVRKRRLGFMFGTPNGKTFGALSDSCRRPAAFGFVQSVLGLSV